MTIEIPTKLIEYVLLGSGDSRRQLQDSPILCDVWVKYTKEPTKPADLLITSHKDTTAHALAAEIYMGVDRPDWVKDDPEVAPLQSFVAARLYFEEVLRVLVPMTKWWHEPRTQAELAQYATADDDNPDDHDGPRKLNQTVDDVASLLERWCTTADTTLTNNRRTAFERFVALCALVFLAQANIPPVDEANPAGTVPTPEMKKANAEAVARMRGTSRSDVSQAVFDVLKLMNSEPKTKPMVWQISLNRLAAPAINRSVPTVKADAARRLFGVDCSEINWAIIDSGIDAQHPAFGPAQLKATYDFTNYRQIVSLGNAKPAVRKENLKALKAARGDSLPLDANRKLDEIARNTIAGRTVRWDLVKEFVLIDKPPHPVSEHGTHVAGIIGARKGDAEESADGMCPGIGIYDFRILSQDIANTEFAVIAALQFIRYTNEQAGFLLINGVNMSLSIPHDVRNYACGGTPVCVESERLIDNRVVVVAAAGNLGYQHTVVGGQPFDSYQALSITDPGNADRVITVGSTHRAAPMTYGVSYFSSRGPTGDGRLKPDLVAPGERIRAPMPDGNWGCLDGTSMAAPHVSGAAAMLMARYPELIGEPERIKRILCTTATDLGRERNFQGHGMLDVLRALQSQ
ncbi:MAG: peptidase and in, kexin, sedolisin [Mycobacterium sp.]|nr:peptidase and in, kexin, sedolisin [Mycobacterium sp.]